MTGASDRYLNRFGDIKEHLRPLPTTIGIGLEILGFKGSYSIPGLTQLPSKLVVVFFAWKASIYIPSGSRSWCLRGASYLCL